MPIKVDELTKKIASSLVAELGKARDAAGLAPDDDVDIQSLPEDTQRKIEKMVKDQLEKAGYDLTPPDKRNKGDFLDDVDDDDKGAGSGFTEKQLRAKGRQKILMDQNMLTRYHGRDTVTSILEFQKLQDDAYMTGKVLAFMKGVTYQQALKETQLWQTMNLRLKSDSELRKALYTSGSGVGAEWIPTGFSNQLYELIRLELKVANLFPVINMPTNPYKMPVQTSGLTSYLIPESTADASTKFKSSTAGTGNFEFSAKKIGARTLWSMEMDEDSIINVLDFVRNDIAIAIAEGIEKAIVNGDDGTTHQDSNVTESWDVQKAFDGLRYFSLNNAGTGYVSFSNAVPSTTLMRSIRLLMGKYGVNPARLAWIVGVKGYMRMLGISETLTLDKYGPAATILNGELGKYDGIPIIVSEHMYENLNASGVYDGSTTNRASMLLVYRPGFAIGSRGGVTIDTEKDIETDQMIMVAKRRLDFEDPYNATLAANVQVASGINVQV